MDVDLIQSVLSETSAINVSFSEFRRGWVDDASSLARCLSLKQDKER